MPFVYSRGARSKDGWCAPELPSLTRQASAPSLDSSTFDVRDGHSANPFPRTGLRRSSSAAAVGPRSTSVKRSSRAQHSAQDVRWPPHDDSGFGGRASRAVQRRSEAFQLEARLSERLRELGRSTGERRPVERPSHGRGAGLSDAWHGKVPFEAPLPAHKSHPSSPFVEAPRHGELVELPESLKVYSDLFEEVIDRDRVFGSLLRKIKTAYDALLTAPPKQHSQVPMQPTFQPPAPPGSRYRGGSGSNEPTTRAEGLQLWELDRENHALKDLVERLHCELEDAVKREDRWKRKAAKKGQLGGPAPQDEWCVRQKHRAQQNESMHRPDHVPHHYLLQQEQPPHQQFLAQHQYPAHKQFGHEQQPSYVAAQQEHRPADERHTSPRRRKRPDAGGVSQESRSQSADGKNRASGSWVRPFHASMREPSVPLEFEEEGSHQAHTTSLHSHNGHHPAPQMQYQLSEDPPQMLSMSSISPNHSAPQQHSELVETARSADSGTLPQRPTRRHCVKPAEVPPLDFTQLQNHVEEDEEDEDGVPEEEQEEVEEGSSRSVQDHSQRSQADEGWTFTNH
eukprot:CAMPEP_0194525150 /NCGR_PEP_ID=MMETSP0253-20130528/60505_1 /TAXON_ID=2966 /ORGANISM="Noctiluca scintillans" /LENGTH=566 /DNA_ID=CAMNT_0039369847 /DNA_START=52 /DNA_END=1752 /DNA_ORIENTATION=+